MLYRHEATGLVLSARCGPPCGSTALGVTTCCCDRLTFAPMSGSFALTKRGMPLIQTAEGGYKMRTELGNVVLVDAQGQLGDYASPMACPGHPYQGERIVAAQLDETTGHGRVLMDLTPAYDPALGITRHEREFIFEPDGRVRLTDRLTADKPHRFTWLFHCYRSCEVTQQGPGAFSLRTGAETLALEAAPSIPLRAALKDTLVVWAYCNENQDEAFQHLEFETESPQPQVTVEFVLR